MRKRFAALLCACMIGSVWAQEGETNDAFERKKDPVFTPVFELTVRPLSQYVVQYDARTNAYTYRTINLDKEGRMLFDLTSGIKIRLIDALSLTPYFSYENEGLSNVPSTPKHFDVHDIAVGIRLDAELPKGFAFGFDAAYSVKLNSRDSDTHYYVGFKLKPELVWEDQERSFLAVRLSNEFSLLANTTDLTDKKIDKDELANTLAFGLVWNCFNFVKRDINTGLYLDLNLGTKWDRSGINDYTHRTVEITNTFDIGFGFITNPIKSFTAKTGLVGEYETYKTQYPGGTTTVGKASSNIGWLFGGVINYRNFSLGGAYTIDFARADRGVELTDILWHRISVRLSYRY